LTDHGAECELRRLLLDQELAVETQPRDARLLARHGDDPQPVGLAELERRVGGEVKACRGVDYGEPERLLADRDGVAMRVSAGSAALIRAGDHASLDGHDLVALGLVEAQHRAASRCAARQTPPAAWCAVRRPPARRPRP
jgi:hypothetical protein